MNITLVATVGFLAATTAAPPVQAQDQYEILHAFKGLAGESKARLLEASDGTLYGLTTKGGRGGAGTIFALRRLPDGFTFETIHEFEGLEGGEPVAALIEADGELYGTTPARGAAGLGTVFKIDPDGNLVLLHTFHGPDGAKPLASLVRGPDGALYGSTSEGGAHNFGTIFSLTLGGSLTTLKSFDGIEATTPTTPLVQGPDGHLYGTTGPIGPIILGPAHGGTIFRITTDGTFDIVHTFGQFEGFPAVGLVLGRDGNFYGIALSFGGPLSNRARFYRITPAGALTPLHTAMGYLGFGNAPMVQGADENFYGTFASRYTQPLPSPGAAYKLTPSGELTLLHEFTAAEGEPHAGLVQARDGFFYGVTFNGGIGNHGIVFQLNAAGTLVTVQHLTGLDGDTPWSPPIRGPDGAFYGTTAKGGVFDLGTIYRVSPDGVVHTIHVFNGTDGAHPFAGLLLGADGFLYGTALYGGCENRGTIFRASISGVVQLLHCFQTGEGRLPFSSLIQGTDGNFYGTTIAGGTQDEGTVFRVAATGALTTLHSFTLSFPFNPPLTLFPFGPLTQGADGNLFGTTAGTAGVFGGTVFTIAPTGGFLSVKHAFQAPIGGTRSDRIFGGLTIANDGFLYGATDRGLLFRVTADAGQGLTEAGTLGGASMSAPIQAGDGSLYGTKVNGGSGSGSIYRFNAGVVSTLKALDETEGVFPVGVTEAAAGILYGTAVGGGPTGRGVLYRFRVQ